MPTDEGSIDGAAIHLLAIIDEFERIPRPLLPAHVPLSDVELNHQLGILQAHGYILVEGDMISVSRHGERFLSGNVAVIDVGGDGR